LIIYKDGKPVDYVPDAWIMFDNAKHLLLANVPYKMKKYGLSEERKKLYQLRLDVIESDLTEITTRINNASYRIELQSLISRKKELLKERARIMKKIKRT